MADPGQESAARAALAEASQSEGLTPGDFTVVHVRRRRRANSKVPFYEVFVEMATGTRLHFRVSVDGRLVERVFG
jgi:hypothetical protein